MEHRHLNPESLARAVSSTRAHFSAWSSVLENKAKRTGADGCQCPKSGEAPDDTHRYLAELPSLMHADPAANGVSSFSPCTVDNDNGRPPASGPIYTLRLPSPAVFRVTPSQSPSVPASVEGHDLPFFPNLPTPPPLLNALADAVPGHSQEPNVFEPALVQHPLAAYDDESVISPHADGDSSPAVRTPEGAEQDASADLFLSPRLTRNERVRLTSLWYYTRYLRDDMSFLAHLQKTVDLIHEVIPHDAIILGLMDKDNYTRLVTSNIPLAVFPRRGAISAHTINQPEGAVLMLPDMLLDPRFAGSQHVAEAGLRSYVGTALRLPLPGTHGSVALGSLCAASWKATSPLSARQQRVLVRFADMIVLDIVEHAQKRRTAEQQSMAGRLTAISAMVDAENVNDVVLAALRETYPDAEVGLQHRPDDTIALAGADPVPYAAFVHYMYEDVAAVEADLLAFNHLPAAAHTGARTLRALAIPRSIDPHLYLVVQTGALEHVFDDVDAAFVHSCSLIMCNVQQAAELQRAAAARARFLRGMSHELRTPIHALLSTCELLAEHTRAQGAALAAEPLGAPDSAARRAEHAALLANAMASGHTLLSTINNLLNYDSLESFAAAPAFVALAGVEQVVLDAAVAAILERGAPVRLVAECALPEGVHLVHTDYDLLRQCLGALVSNAVHFTSAGSITFRTSLEHPADGGVPALVYDVIDTGPGVPPADIARIFLPFEKADAHAPGVGLGLTVAAPTARALGGEVSLVASSPNGSHFRLRLAHPTLASQRGHPSRRVARAALPRTFHVAPDAPPLLVDAAGVLLAVGFAAAPLAQAALVLRASPPVGASDAIMAGVAPRQLVLCLHGSEDDAHVARDAVGAEARVVHASAPLYGAHLWPALVKAADVFDALDLAPRWAAPRRAPSPAPPCRAPASSRPRSVPRLLVVDDNKTNLAILRLYARRRGHAHEAAADGAQAVALFREAAATANPISLVLMDLQMPVMDGVEAVRLIRAHEATHALPPSLIYMVSGQSFDTDKRRAMDAGADGYFVKPLSLRTLDNLIALHFTAPLL